MLKNILKEISVARAYSPTDIAEKLDITEALVEEGISQLERMNYIIEDMGSPNCETTCSKCPMASLCNTVKLRTINITEKGKKLLENI